MTVNDFTSESKLEKPKSAKEEGLFDIPKLNVFKVKEDCCFEKVVYAGTVIGITGKIDKEGIALIPGICYVIPVIPG